MTFLKPHIATQNTLFLRHFRIHSLPHPNLNVIHYSRTQETKQNLVSINKEKTCL